MSQDDALKIRRTAGPNLIKPKDTSSTLGLFVSQFKSPISRPLIGAAVLSFFLNDNTDFIRAGLSNRCYRRRLLCWWFAPRQVAYRSRPSRWLAGATSLIAVVVLLLPISPLARVFGFTTMPLSLYGAIIGIVISAEALILSDVQEVGDHLPNHVCPIGGDQVCSSSAMINIRSRADRRHTGWSGEPLRLQHHF